MLNKRLKHIRRKKRITFTLKSRANNRIRLYFYSSNKYIYSQVIDDDKNHTLTSIATHSPIFRGLNNMGNIEAAKNLGQKVARFLLERNIKNIYFDRGGFKYHGKAKAFAESVRENGLNF